MPYNIIKEGRKYELRLTKNNQLLGTHKTKREAIAQMQAIEINKNKKKLFKKVKIGNHTYKYYLSDKPSKKLMTIVNGKKIYFGSTLYKNYKDQTSLLDPAFQHFDEKRRKRYIARASKIRDKEGNLTYLNPESANFHAFHILW